MTIRSLINFSLPIVVAIVLEGACTFAGGNDHSIELVAGRWLDSEGVTSTTPVGLALQGPFGVDFDVSGNMYVAELSGGRIHKLSPGGRRRIIAGKEGTVGYDGDGGPAANATFNGMHNVAVSRAGDLYVADSWNNCVRHIDLDSGKISTIAGTGAAGFRGDGGDAREALFDFIMCVSLNPTEDALYVADLHNLRIREITLKTGAVRTIAGNGDKGIPKDGSLATENPLVDPRAVAVDSHQNVYVLERGGHALRVVKPDGRIFTVAGNGERGNRDGVGTQSQLNAPKHLCVDERGVVYIADDENRRIRRYDPSDGVVSTLLGAGQGTPAVQLSHPHGVCIENGDLYIVDTGHNRILRMSVTKGRTP